MVFRLSSKRTERNERGRKGGAESTLESGVESYCIVRHRSYDSEACEYNYTHMSTFESTSCDLSLPDSRHFNCECVIVPYGQDQSYALRESEPRAVYGNVNAVA